MYLANRHILRSTLSAALAQHNKLKQTRCCWTCVLNLDLFLLLLGECDRHPAGLLNAQTLLNKAAEAAADLELQLPPLNAPLVLQRNIIELGMPQVPILCHTQSSETMLYCSYVPSCLYC